MESTEILGSERVNVTVRERGCDNFAGEIEERERGRGELMHVEAEEWLTEILCSS